MNFTNLNQVRSTAMNSSKATVKCPPQYMRNDTGHPNAVEKSIDCQPGIKKIDMSSVKFMFKIRNKKICSNSVAKEVRELPAGRIEPAVPKAPRVFKACRLISSLNSSQNGDQPQASMTNLQISPAPTPSTGLQRFPFELKRIFLARQSQEPKRAEEQTNKSRQRDTSVNSKSFLSRKSRLALELNKQPPAHRKSDLYMSRPNESLHNDFIKFKCLDDFNKSTRTYIMINL